MNENDQEQSMPSIVPSPQIQKPTTRKWLSVLLIVVALMLGAGGGYILANNNDAKDADSQSVTSKSTQATNTKPVATATNTFHTVQFDSFSSVITKLAFPENYQAIASDNGPDGIRSLFGDDKGTFSYHGGSWELGNPESGDGNGWGKVEIMGIADDWSARNGFATYGGFNGDSYANDTVNTSVNGYDFSTAAQKKASLSKMISDTSACAKDATKGFTISGSLNVCYKPFMIRQARGAYSPRIQLNGYASIKNVPYILFGSVQIRSGLDNYSEDDIDKAGNDFQAGKIPSPTQKNIDAFVSAFKHSTVVAK